MGNGIGNQLPKSDVVKSENSPDFKEIEVRVNIGDSYKERATRKRSRQPSCIRESGQLDGFVMALIRPNHDLPNLISPRRQRSDFNEWDVCGHVTRLNELSGKRKKSNNSSIKPKGGPSSYLLDIELL